MHGCCAPLLLTGVAGEWPNQARKMARKQVLFRTRWLFLQSSPSGVITRASVPGASSGQQPGAGVFVSFREVGDAEDRFNRQRPHLGDPV